MCSIFRAYGEKMRKPADHKQPFINEYFIDRLFCAELEGSHKRVLRTERKSDVTKLARIKLKVQTVARNEGHVPVSTPARNPFHSTCPWIRIRTLFADTMLEFRTKIGARLSLGARNLCPTLASRGGGRKTRIMKNFMAF